MCRAACGPRKLAGSTRIPPANRDHTCLMLQDRRAQPRESIALPFRIAGGPRAVTRDISCAGLFFVLPGCHELRGSVHFELHLPGYPIKFAASGHIVRLEHEPLSTGVAVRFTTARLVSAAPQA